MKHGITFAWTLNGAGSGTKIETAHVAEEIHNEGLAWVHINDTTKSACRWIEKKFSYLDKIIVDALLADETHPRYLEHNNGILLILRGVNLNPDQKPEDMVSIRVWADEHRIITVERRPVKTIQDIDHSLNYGLGPKNSGDFLAALTGHLFDHIEDLSSRLHAQLDELETAIEKDAGSASRGDVMNLRRAAVTFLRYIAPQRDVISHLRHTDLKWVHETHRRDFAEDGDRLNRIIGDLELLRSRAQIAAEELDSFTTQKVNRNLYILSTITTIFMPLTFITGLLGMNVGGIPGTSHPWAFTIICGLLIAIALLHATYLKWRNWL